MIQIEDGKMHYWNILSLDPSIETSFTHQIHSLNYTHSTFFISFTNYTFWEEFFSETAI